MNAARLAVGATALMNPNYAHHRTDNADPLDLDQLAASGIVSILDDDQTAPVTVVRLAHSDLAHLSDEGLPPSLAALLVGMFTSTGDTVLSFDHEPAVDGACGAGGRRHITAAAGADLADLDRESGRITLITARWPRQHPVDVAALADMFAICRLLMAPNGRMIISTGSPTARQLYIHDAAHLTAAAASAGLQLQQRVVAVVAPIADERPPRRTAPADRAALRRATYVAVRRDVAVFASGGGHD